MTAGSYSLGEVRAVLAEVTEALGTAHRCARTAQQRVTEAAAVLGELDGAHHDSLVPPELARAHRELSRGLGLIAAGVDAVAVIDARL